MNNRKQITADNVIAILLIVIAFFAGLTIGLGMITSFYTAYPLYIGSMEDCSEHTIETEFIITPDSIFDNAPYPVRLCNLIPNNSYYLNITNYEGTVEFENRIIKVNKTAETLMFFSDYSAPDGIVIANLYNETTQLDTYITVIINIQG